MQRNVAILLRGNATGRNCLAGILKRIKDADNFAIRIASDAADFRRLATSASALIADTSADEDTVRSAIADGKQVVLLNDWRFKEHSSNLGLVRTNDGEIGFRAADYLMSIGRFRSFGFVPAYSGRQWSRKRGEAFAYRLGRKGIKCRMFTPGENGDLGSWLGLLPKPAAVFCAWDGVASEVSNAAKEAKIKIPAQVVVLGADNDETYCTSVSPHLSSIEFNTEIQGRATIDLLIEMMSVRKGKTARIICCGTVKRIVERESTRPPAPVSRLIERATTFIAANAVRGIRPKDVATHLGVSRTLLDLRLREMGCATVGNLILEKRLAALSSMLRRPKMPISRMIKECGFGSVNHAKAVFKKRFGMTMREWRSSGIPLG